MSYLLDKKAKQKKMYYGVLFLVIFLILFYFRTGFFKGLAFVSNIVFHPVLVVGNSVDNAFHNVGIYFAFKSSLSKENEDLKSRIDADVADRANYDSVLAENATLKEILGRKNEKTPMVLAVILSKPNQSVYDTLIIDAGSDNGLKTGDIVFASGNIPIGKVDTVYSNSSKVILFSNPNEKTEVVVGSKNVYMDLIGRGGGNFEMILPKDFTLVKGDQAVLPDMHTYLVATVETILSDPRDSFIKAILTSPINISELKFVEVGI